MRLPSRQAIPLADAAALRDPVRRTAIIRWVLAGALVVVVVIAAVLAQRPASSEIVLAKGGRSGVVVLDLSASIGSPRRRITEPFEYLARTGQEFGLVLFSGTAYEAAPPGTSSTELRGIMNALSPFANVCVAMERAPCPPHTRRVEPDSVEADRIRRESVTPWTENFRGGTVISSGLILARKALERHNMTERGVLLVSDLDDSLLDIPQLTRELITYREQHIPLNVVALDPFDEDRFYFERMVGRGAFVDRAQLTPRRLVDEKERAERAGVPEGLAALALLLLTLLAVNEHFCGRLAWRPRR
jgi:hypothetical protein